MKRIVKLMKIISNQIDAKMQILLADTDLTSSQVIILQYLINHECLNQKQICATFKLSSATVNGILNRLEDKGYIEREKSDDKRNNRIILTSKALAINEKLIAPKKSNVIFANKNTHKAIKYIEYDTAILFFIFITPNMLL